MYKFSCGLVAREQEQWGSLARRVRDLPHPRPSPRQGYLDSIHLRAKGEELEQRGTLRSQLMQATCSLTHGLA